LSGLRLEVHGGDPCCANPGRGSYAQSSRNGVTGSDYAAWPGSFSVSK